MDGDGEQVVDGQFVAPEREGQPADQMSHGPARRVVVAPREQHREILGQRQVVAQGVVIVDIFALCRRVGKVNQVARTSAPR